MGKKDSRRQPEKSPEPAKPDALKHNPFAALSNLQGKTTSHATEPEKPSEPLENKKPLKSKGRLVLRRETKHRAGKAVVVISGLSELRDFDARAADALAKELKQKLGCGGGVEMNDGKREIVLQGDKAPNVAALLREKGFRVDGVTT